jgi:hypothetical protein
MSVLKTRKKRYNITPKEEETEGRARRNSKGRS